MQCLKSPGPTWIYMITWLLLLNGRWCSQAPEFVCQDGTEIPVEKFCDGIQDCDGSDEVQTKVLTSGCITTKTSCFLSATNRQCLLDRDYICNGTIKCENTTLCDVGCPSHYKCQDGSCVPRSTVCDRDGCNGCSENHDWSTGIGFKCVRNGETCLIPQQLLWGNVQDCDDGLDLCYHINLTFRAGRDLRMYAGAAFNQKSCFFCLDGSMIVPRSKLCDGIIDCSDLSDECLCPVKVPSICDMVHTRLPVNRNFRVPIRQGANTIKGVNASGCQYGQISCNTSVLVCVDRSKICDGIVDCPLHEDERNEYCAQTLPCAFGKPQAGMECRCDGNRCRRNYGVWCNGVDDCPLDPNIRWNHPPGYPADECQATCPEATKFACSRRSISAVGSALGQFLCDCFVILHNGTRIVKKCNVSESARCNGIVDCTADYLDEKNCTNRFTCPNGTRVNIPMENVCDGVVDCDNKWDENATTCPDRFFCSSLQGQKVSVPKKAFCDFYINCDHAEDETNCSTAERFYCEHGSPLFVARSKLFDGRGDCTDWSDECPMSGKAKQENILSSHYELIGNPFLRAFVWIVGLTSLFGNLIVIVGESIKIKSFFGKDESASLTTNHMLVLNLAISDLLMGVYLIMLGVAGVVYSDVYCAKSLEWLTSQACSTMGVLVVISSETSMLTIVLLTVSRLYAVFNPIPAMRKPKKRSVILLLLFTWTLSTSVALVPLFWKSKELIVERAWIQDHPFFGDVIHFKDAKLYTEKILTYLPDLANISESAVQQVSQITSWVELENFFATFKQQSGLLIVYRYFSYYGENSVCIPNLFVTRETWSWKFSLSFTIINFFSFVFVATAYMIIILKAKNGMAAANRHNLKHKTSIGRKVTRLIVTDFCCWIPLSIMVFAHFSGVKVDSIAYSVAGIVLLPINSALNPILYSNFIDNFWLNCKQKCKDRKLSGI